MKTILAAVNSKYIHTALGLRYINAYCQQQGLDTTLMEETINTPILTVLSRLTASNPDIIGLDVHIWNRTYVFELVTLLRQVLPEVVLLLGGPEVMFDPQGVRKSLPQIDYVIIGEGEEVMARLLRDLEAGRKPLLSEQPALVQDLSVLPFPYPDLAAVLNQHKICYYECSRGCPFQCSYCLSGISHAVRQRPLKLVIQDLDRFIAAGVPLLKFVDRTYNLDEDYYLPILEHLAKAQTKATFHLEIKVDLLSARVLDFLDTVPKGRFQMEIGVQSTNPQTLKAIGRQDDWVKLKTNVQRLLNAGRIHIHMDLIAGLPYEGLKEYAQSFNDVYRLQPQMLQLGFLKVLHGTVMEKTATEHGLVYMQQPPYEVLATKYLPYKDLRFLKVMEEVFEVTYNSGRFPRMLAYLVDYWHQDAFAFYSTLTDWWIQRGLFGIGHKPAEVTALLLSFVKDRLSDSLDVVTELLRFDVFCFQAGFKPDWLKWRGLTYYEEFSSFLRTEAKVRRYFSDYKFTNWRMVHKRYGLEAFLYEPDTFAPKSCFYMIDYDKMSTEKIQLS